MEKVYLERKKNISEESESSNGKKNISEKESVYIEPNNAGLYFSPPNQSHGEYLKPNHYYIEKIKDQDSKIYFLKYKNPQERQMVLSKIIESQIREYGVRSLNSYTFENISQKEYQTYFMSPEFRQYLINEGIDPDTYGKVPL